MIEVGNWKWKTGNRKSLMENRQTENCQLQTANRNLQTDYFLCKLARIVSNIWRVLGDHHWASIFSSVAD